MKRQIYLALLMLALLTGCTHNNGDIGHLFGQWKLEEVLINDVPLTDYDGNVFWSFQSTTICIKSVTSSHDYGACYGNWHEADNTMFVDFPEESYQNISILYDIHMQRDTQLAIIQADSRTMLLQHSPDAETTVTYRFKKW